MRLKRFGFAGLLVVAAAMPSLAHHSAAAFDRSQEVTLVGTLKEVLWTNPHGWIDLFVTDSTGKSVLWSIEASTPSGFAKMGLKKDPPYPAPGDKITVVAHPLRDGRPGGSLIVMTLADGKVLGSSPVGATAPFTPAANPPAGAPAR